MQKLLHQFVWFKSYFKSRQKDCAHLSSIAPHASDSFRLLVDGVRDYAIFMLDKDGRVASWNKGAERMQVYSSGEAAGVPFAFFFSNEDILAARPEKLLERAAFYGSADEEGWQYRKDGSRFWARVVVSALHDKWGNLCGFSNVTQDISRQKAVEAELKTAKELAEAANRAKTSFLTNISHEIRTPLGAVLGFTELMNDPGLSPTKREELAAMVRRNGSQLTHLINDLLDLSKVEANRLELEAIEFDFIDLLNDVMAVAEAQIAAGERPIELELKFNNPLPNALNADPTRIRQVLLNIVGNAIKFTESGLITLSVESHPCEGSRQNCKIQFCVKDTGIGMSAEQQSRIFQPFSQADCSTTRKFGGTGLGLVLARKLTALMGGNLELISSELGRGSEFCASIVVRVAQTVTFENHREPEFLTRRSRWLDESPSKLSTPSLAGINVLLVEDSLDNQFLIKQLLTRAKASVSIANNGLEGVEMALKGDYHLVLMDVQMPVLDGFAATEKLRKLSYTRPIIAVTAHAFREERERCLRAGCNDQMTKPIDRTTLINMVAEYVYR